MASIANQRWAMCRNCQIVVDREVHKEKDCIILTGWISSDKEVMSGIYECMRCNKSGTCFEEIMLWSDSIMVCTDCMLELGVNKTVRENDSLHQDFRDWCIECLWNSGMVQRRSEFHPTECTKCKCDLYFYKHQIYIDFAVPNPEPEVPHGFDFLYYCKSCAPVDASTPQRNLCQAHAPKIESNKWEPDRDGCGR